MPELITTNRHGIVSLDQAKTEKQAEIKMQRNKDIYKPYNNVKVSTANQRDDVNGSIEYFETLAPGGTISWTMADGTEQDLTKINLQAIKDGFVIRKAQTMAAWQAKKQQINDATSTEELSNI